MRVGCHSAQTEFILQVRGAEEVNLGIYIEERGAVPLGRREKNLCFLERIWRSYSNLLESK